MDEEWRGRDQHGYCPLVEDGTATTCLGLDNGIALEVNDRRVHETSGTGDEGTAAMDAGGV